MVCYKQLGVPSFYRLDGETRRDGQATVATWLRAASGMAEGGDRQAVSWRCSRTLMRLRSGGKRLGGAGALSGRGGGFDGERWL